MAELYGDMPGVVESVKRALAGESLVTTMQLQHLFFEIAYSPIHVPDGTVTGVIGVARNVTERHKAEQALEVSERRMRLIVENAYDAFVAMDHEGTIVDWNPQAEVIFGWSREAAVGRSMAQTIIPERMRKAHLDGLVHYLHTGEGPVLNRRIEMQALRRGGEEFPVEMTISTMRIEDTVLFSAFIHDISERVRAKEELERTAEELRRSNEELEQFAYVASHDLQEPLRMVASYTQLLERRYAGQLDQPAREFIGFAVDGARRMQEFIAGLLRYSRVGTEARVFERVDLDKVLATALANLRIAIEEIGAKIDSRELPVVMGDARQLTQLFQNLVGNALKFRKPGQAPRIEIWAERDGGCWRVSVRDDGIGLDPQFSERVFAIFQRLHAREEYEGTGLGLAICKKIVERHGGRISGRVKARRGRRLLVYAPRRGPSLPMNESSEIPLAETPVRILLVEDDLADARLFQEMLADADAAFSIEHVRSLSEAVGSLARCGIDVVMCDLSLPDSQRLATFENCTRPRAHMPVIVLSGLDDEPLAVETVQRGAQDYLVKGRADTHLLVRSIRYALSG